MLETAAHRARIETTLAKALAGPRPDDGLFSVTVALPDLPFRGLPAGLAAPTFWGRPDGEYLLLGLGETAREAADGPERFRRLAEAHGRWRERWIHHDPDATGFHPAVFLNFAFAAADAAGLYLPRLLLRRQGSLRAVTVTLAAPFNAEAVYPALLAELDGLLERLGPPSTPPADNPLTRLSAEPEDAAWLGRVRAALDDIAAGRLDKVVLTRRLRVIAPHRFDPARLMAALAYRHPGCALLAASGPMGTAVAATPERLVRLVHGRVDSEALAGTLRRDADEAEDARLAERLRHSVKDRHEHDLVVQSLRHRLAPLCTDLDIPVAPQVLRLRSLMHLRTPIRGRARPGVSLIDVAEALHPTPAVGGCPRAAALAWLDEHGERRGPWYSGGFGWIDGKGEGEISVVLRCALIQDRIAELAAGAGIVAGSDPETELAEAELKFRAMLDALEDA